MDKIRRVSCFFRYFFIIIMFSLPVTLAVFWLTSPLHIATTLAQYGLVVDYIPQNLVLALPLPESARWWGLVINVVPLLIHMYILYMLTALFGLFSRGCFFLVENVNCIRRVGMALFVGQLVNPFYQAALTTALTWHNGPGLRWVGVVWTGADLGVLFIAMIIVLTSWIIAEGVKLEEEQRYTV